MTGEMFIAPATSVLWKDSGAGTKLLDLGGMSDATAKMGAYADLGDGARSGDYEVEFLIDGFDTAPDVGKTITLYFSQSNDTTGFDGRPDTDPTDTTEGVITEGQTHNCLPACIARVYSTTTTKKIQARGIVSLTGRYVAPVVLNKSGGDLLGTGDSHHIKLTPIPLQVQA